VSNRTDGRRSRSAGPARPTSSARGGDPSPWVGLQGRARQFLDTPQLDYRVLMTATVALVVIGLIMALSSSMVSSVEDGGGVFSSFMKQAVLVVAGLVAMWFAMRLKPTTIRRYSPWLLGIAVVALLLVLTPFGTGGNEVGSKSWIRIGPIGIQPSEIAKMALAVWGSASVAVHARRERTFFRGLGPFLCVAGFILVLVLAQNDLGMMLSVGLVVFAMLYFGGSSWKVLVGGAAAGAVVAAGFTLTHSFRGARFSTWVDAVTLSFSDATSQGDAYQAKQGILSLASGGFTGEGLGQSRAKWSYLPESTNDFVFAILGEELGWIGAGLVVVLFGVLGWFGIRTAVRQSDPFLRLMAATLTIGIVFQAMFNIGYVIGLLPVTGVQLPLISSGGTSAIITLASLGLLMTCARHEPEAISSMQHEGRPLLDRILFLPEPRPYVAGGEQRDRVRPQPRRYGDPVTRRAEHRTTARSTPPRSTSSSTYRSRRR
jgi:cell division protein FtsW